MKLSARVLFSVGKFLCFLLALSCVLLPLSSLPALAAEDDASVTTTYEPNTNPDVPRNQHTLAQTVTIDVFAAIICQLTGKDIVNPDKGCLGIDPTTQKIGYTSQDPNKVGGLAGTVSTLVGAVYTQPASGVSYIARTVDDFGIVKEAHAQDKRTGFDLLAPVQLLWMALRNVTYLFFVVIFILLGVGIMLRMKIDPRTVMSIQNQLPRIVVAILLITFSYSIVGIMIDMMWLTTYVGINVLTDATPNQVNDACVGKTLPLKENVYNNILNFPLAFVDDIFRGKVVDVTEVPSDADCVQSGTGYLATQLGAAVSNIVADLVNSVLNPDQFPCTIDLNPLSFKFAFQECIASGVASVVSGIANIFFILIGIIAILSVTIRLWLTLLKAYAYVIIYTITGPLWIVFGLFPNSSLGLQGWLRTLAAKLLAFPVAAFFIICSRVVLDLYHPAVSGDPVNGFVPPLVGNPGLGAFGPILAFAILLITPEVLNMLNDSLKAPSNKYTGPAVNAGIGLGGSIVGGFVGGQMSRLWRYDHSKHEIGALRGAFEERVAFPVRQRMKMRSANTRFQEIRERQNRDAQARMSQTSPEGRAGERGPGSA